MDLFGKLPGVGSRSAERMVFHLLKSDPQEAFALADAIRDVKEQVRHCSICFHLTETDPCSICSDAGRDRGIICVVEQPRDLMQLEATGVYKGVYHVLLGHLAPLDGIGPENLTTNALLKRISQAGTGIAVPVREVILATNPTMDGDGTAVYLQQCLAATDVTVTRLARGLVRWARRRGPSSPVAGAPRWGPMSGPPAHRPAMNQ
jgi:recombination protein RecR